MKQTLIALALALPLMACSPEPSVVLPPSEEEIEQKLSDAQTQSAPQEDGIGSEIAAGVAGAAVGALAMNALSNNNNRSSGYEVEKCDWDDKPWEPECRNTKKYYDWKAKQNKSKSKITSSSKYKYNYRKKK